MEIVAFRDITERKKAEKALQEAYGEMEMIVAERTEELMVANKELEWEIARHEKTEVELFQRASELSTMLNISRVISSTLQFEDVIANIAEQMINVIGVTGCTLYQWNQEDNIVETMIARRLHAADSAVKSVFPLDDLPTFRKVLKDCMPSSVQVADTAVDPVEKEFLQESKVASLLVLPLAIGGKAIGLVGLGDERERVFTDAEVRLCQAISDQAAVAIEPAWLHAETRGRLKEQTALKMGKKGKITVTTKHIDQDVEIRIADTGNGIPENIRGRVFDLFFTTKEVGKGTGQGLAIAHNVIVEKHGGTLTFETEDGVGTTFIMRLPVD